MHGGTGLSGERREIEIGADGKTGDEYIAAEEEVILGPLKLQPSVGQRADTLGVADVGPFRSDREVGEDAVLIGEVAAQAE